MELAGSCLAVLAALRSLVSALGSLLGTLGAILAALEGSWVALEGALGMERLLWDSDAPEGGDPPPLFHSVPCYTRLLTRQDIAVARRSTYLHTCKRRARARGLMRTRAVGRMHAGAIRERSEVRRWRGVKGGVYHSFRALYGKRHGLQRGCGSCDCARLLPYRARWPR